MESWWELGQHSGYSGSELNYVRLECAFCSAKGNFELAHRETKRHADDEHHILYFDTLKCGNCANFLMAFWSGDHLHDYRVIPRALNSRPEAPEEWPAGVARFWTQAKGALGRQDYDAASVMTRSAMQAALRLVSATGRTLRDEINDLATRGLLPPTMKEWADELRELGNASAHPGPQDEPPKAKDIRDVVEFLEYLLFYLFTLPKRIDQYRGRRDGSAAG